MNSSYLPSEMFGRHAKGVSNRISDAAKNPYTDNGPVIATKAKKKRDGSGLRKAPGAPKRFKSSYIMFFMAKQQEIKSELGASASVGAISKRSSEKWKSLSAEDRAYWDAKAEADKERYNIEKEKYTGPWQIPNVRRKKNPDAPKRPMSAFLYFSQDKRRMIKAANPDMRNTEVSRVLGDMWKKVKQEERDPHIQREADERAKYKIATAKWKEEEAAREKERMNKPVELKKEDVAPTRSRYHKPSPSEFNRRPSPIPLQLQPLQPSSAPSNVQQPYYVQSGNYGYPPPSHGYGPPSGFSSYPYYPEHPPTQSHYDSYSSAPQPDYQSRNFQECPSIKRNNSDERFRNYSGSPLPLVPNPNYQPYQAAPPPHGQTTGGYNYDHYSQSQGHSYSSDYPPHNS
mmetsp:Transcript_13869/g.15639  ORF Transcript_13869/g.15639 Transcript_13869/m.15639 type:complete len:400 (+) Transcript_13869:148-1347(+)